MRRKPAPKVALQCPKCTRTVIVPGDAPSIVCPTCAFEGARAPGEWERANLDDLRPGRQHEIHGRPRDTATVLLLTVGTLGIYGLVYAYKAFRELDAQHGRLHATWWYLYGLFGLLLVVPGLVILHVYWCIELRRLQTYRKARGLRRRIGPLGYSLWVLLVPVVGFVVAIGLVNQSIAEVWRHVHKQAGLKPRLS
jgi:hypothetical protein